MSDVATAPAPVETPTPTPAAPAAPAAFDWKTTGIDDAGMVTITERGFKTPGDLLTSYRNLEAATGVPPERLIKLPSQKDMADPKAWDQIFNKLGRPETPDKYVIPVPEGDKGEFANAVKPWLHEAGISQSAATKLATQWNTFLAQTQQQQQTALDAKNLAEVTQLKSAWGADYEAHAAIVDRAADTFGMSQPQLDALKTAMGPKAAMEFLYNLGSKVAVEDTTVPGMTEQRASFGGMTPEMAKAKIAEYSKPGSGFAQLMESKDPKQRMEAQHEWNTLHQLASRETVQPQPARRA